MSDLLTRYLSVVETRAQDQKGTDASALVRGLDKFSRRLTGLSQLLPGTDFGRMGTELITRVSLHHCTMAKDGLVEYFKEEILRDIVVAADKEKKPVSEIVATVLGELGRKLKLTLASLQVILGATWSFV